MRAEITVDEKAREILLLLEADHEHLARTLDELAALHETNHSNRLTRADRATSS